MTRVNGPEPTGFGFFHFVRSPAFEKTAWGTIQTLESCAPTYVESVCLKWMATLPGPARRTHAMLLFFAVRPMWSSDLSTLPIVRL